MGCSSSKNATSIVLPEKLSSNQIKPLPMEKTVLQSTRFLESCLIIWFYDETSNKLENEREQLRKLVYGLKIFDNIDACTDFITAIQDEKVFLIVSGTSQIVERFQYLPQIEKIYIFDSSFHEFNNVKRQYLNYDIVENLDILYKQLEEDIKLCEMDFILIIVAPLLAEKTLSLSSLTKQEASFLFGQIMNELTYRTKFESVSKDGFIDFCRAHYMNSDEQLSVIDNFAKNYRPNKALWWLTKECFIARILNRVQHTHEIDILYKLGFFMKQVNIQLSRLHEENASLMKNISMVYRGKTMSSDEFDALLKDKCGRFLSFSNFLTATTNKEVAVDFVDRRRAMHPDMIGIVFEIHIDHTIFNEKSPFALLKDTDMNKDEICFNMSTVFRIESVEQTINDTMVMCFVKLKLINDDHQQLRSLIAPARSDEIHANPMSYVGKLLIDMGEYKRAEQFLVGLLQDTTFLSLPRRVVRAHNGLGVVYTHMNEYAKALDHYQQSLETSLIYLQPDHPDLAPIYQGIGDIYLNQSDYIHAIEKYEKSIELLKGGTQQVNSEILNDLETRVNQARESIESNK
jgi:tetratricopeptide (TPR) repeat protein